MRTAINQKGAELQSLVPVVNEDKEIGPLNLDFNNCKELQGDNERKIEKGRFLKAFKRLKNMFKKHFSEFS